MEIMIPSKLPIEIINHGNGLPAIAPCRADAQEVGGGGGFGVCDSSYLCGNWGPMGGK